MKSTGIIRRIDDLGRIAIPKEIRRTLKIRENDPMEFFLGKDNTLYLQKYIPIGEKDWDTAKVILEPILATDYVLLNRYGDVERRKGTIPCKNRDEAEASADLNVFEIKIDGEIDAYLVVAKSCDETRANIAKDLLKTFFAQSN